MFEKGVYSSIYILPWLSWAREQSNKVEAYLTNLLGLAIYFEIYLMYPF